MSAALGSNYTGKFPSTGTWTTLVVCAVTWYLQMRFGIFLHANAGGDQPPHKPWHHENKCWSDTFVCCWWTPTFQALCDADRKCLIKRKTITVKNNYSRHDLCSLKNVWRAEMKPVQTIRCKSFNLSRVHLLEQDGSWVISYQGHQINR